MGNKELVEVEGYPGFYEISICPGYAINKMGDVVNLSTGYFLTGYKTKPNKRVTNNTGGYVVYHIRDKCYNRHRLLALTFLPLPENNTCGYKLVVNHKDGVPGNDSLENLEWCTYSENTLHAYRNGLHPNKVINLLVKDIVTNKVYEFTGVQAVSEFTGLTPCVISNRLNRQPGATYGRFAIKRNDDTEWPVGGIRTLETIRPLKARNIIDKKIIISDTAKVLAEIIGCKAATLIAHLSRKSARLINGYDIKYLDDNTPWMKFSDSQIKILTDLDFIIPGRYAYFLENIKSSEIKVYRCLEDMAKELNTTRPTLYKLCIRNNLFNKLYRIYRVEIFPKHLTANIKKSL